MRLPNTAHKNEGIMSSAEPSRDDRSADHAEAGTDVSRRHALGRLATYAAPLMLALLVKRTSYSRQHFRQHRLGVTPAP
jgi:hypothetical protein